MRADLEGGTSRPLSNKKKWKRVTDCSRVLKEDPTSGERTYRAISSANWTIWQPRINVAPQLDRYKLKSIGLKIDPCGTPLYEKSRPVRQPSTTNCNSLRQVSYINQHNFGGKPTSMRWNVKMKVITLSNAPCTSRNKVLVACLEINPWCISVDNMPRLSRHEALLWNPYWKEGRIRDDSTH